MTKTKTLTNLLKNKNIRALYNKETGCYLFCAVDICAVLCNTKKQTAKSYWQTKKRRDIFFSMEKGYVNKTLTLPAIDGKFYKTDVIDMEAVLYLIKTIARANGLVYKLLLKTLGTDLIVQALKHKAKEESNKIKNHIDNKKKTIYLASSVHKHYFVLSAPNIQSIKETLIKSREVFP